MREGARRVPTGCSVCSCTSNYRAAPLPFCHVTHLKSPGLFMPVSHFQELKCHSDCCFCAETGKLRRRGKPALGSNSLFSFPPLNGNVFPPKLKTRAIALATVLPHSSLLPSPLAQLVRTSSPSARVVCWIPSHGISKNQ